MGFAVRVRSAGQKYGQRATKGTVLTSQSLSPWCDCRRLGSTWASWRWQDINVGNPLWRRVLLPPGDGTCSFLKPCHLPGEHTTRLPFRRTKNYSNTQAFPVLPGIHLLLGRESARVRKDLAQDHNDKVHWAQPFPDYLSQFWDLVVHRAVVLGYLYLSSSLRLLLT